MSGRRTTAGLSAVGAALLLMGACSSNESRSMTDEEILQSVASVMGHHDETPLPDDVAFLNACVSSIEDQLGSKVKVVQHQRSENADVGPVYRILYVPSADLAPHGTISKLTCWHGHGGRILTIVSGTED